MYSKFKLMEDFFADFQFEGTQSIIQGSHDGNIKQLVTLHHQPRS